jgi:hypothetical protein
VQKGCSFGSRTGSTRNAGSQKRGANDRERAQGAKGHSERYSFVPPTYPFPPRRGSRFANHRRVHHFNPRKGLCARQNLAHVFGRTISSVRRCMQLHATECNGGQNYSLTKLSFDSIRGAAAKNTRTPNGHEFHESRLQNLSCRMTVVCHGGNIRDELWLKLTWPVLAASDRSGAAKTGQNNPCVFRARVRMPILNSCTTRTNGHTPPRHS